MKRAILAGLGLLPLAWQAASGASAYEQAEKRYENLVAAHVHGEPCRGRSSIVLSMQDDLASTIPSLSPEDGGKVLLFAVASNSVHEVQRLLAAGALKTGDKGTLLHVAARLGDLPMLEALVTAGFAIEERGEASAPALFVAVAENRKDVVEWLISHGADVNATDNSGYPALSHVFVCKDPDMLGLLLKAGARLDPRTIDLARRSRIDLRRTDP